MSADRLTRKLRRSSNLITRLRSENVNLRRKLKRARRKLNPQGESA